MNTTNNQQLTPNKAKRLGAYKTALMLTAILLTCNTYTYAQQWKWAQTYSGSTGGWGSSKQNYILRSHLDTAGNVYMFGQFGAGATRNNTSTQLDDERAGQSGWKNGVIVGKMGADGEFIWKKVVRSNNSAAGCGHITAQWAEFREDAIYVMLNFECYTDGASTNKLHFFGVEKNKTEILATNTPPFKTGYWTALVKFGYDGVVLDQHFIQVGYDNFNYFLYPLTPFHVDNNGNTYIFTRLDISLTPISVPFTLNLGSGTPYTFNIPKREQNLEPVIIKLNSNWQVQWVKQMYYNVTDNSNVTTNNPIENLFQGLSFDENDNMYLTGTITLSPSYNDLMYIYFATNHRLELNDNTYFNAPTGYIVKYDTNGNVQWCNQIYANGIAMTKNFLGSELVDNEVFVLGNEYSNSAFYNGSGYIGVTSPNSTQQDRTFVVKFNKETGLYLNHGIIPNVRSTKLLTHIEIPSNLAIINNYVVAKSAMSTISTGINSKYHLIASFRTDNCQFVEALDTVKFANEVMGKTTGSVSGNSNGDVFIHFISPSNTMNLGNLSPVYIIGDNAVFALKNDPRLLMTYERIDVTGVTLNKNATALLVGNTEQLIKTILPTNASNQSVSWLSSAPAIATVNNGLVTAVSAGQATVTVTTQDGSFTAQCVVTVTDGSGINEVLANSISIYPNPAKDELRIKSEELRINNVEISDVAGKTLSNHYSLFINSIDVSTLTQGIYLLKIYTDKGVITKRFVKN